jgi:hypothetical protein
MVFFPAVQGVGSLLVTLPLLCSSFSDTFGMALELIACSYVRVRVHSVAIVHAVMLDFESILLQLCMLLIDLEMGFSPPLA